jgi:hypothetical protein
MAVVRNKVIVGVAALSTAEVAIRSYRNLATGVA